MQGDNRVVQYLNRVLTCELTSINQYFLHARIFRNWGLEVLNEGEYKKSIRDMKQADELIDESSFWRVCPTCSRSTSFASVNTSQRCSGATWSLSFGKSST